MQFGITADVNENIGIDLELGFQSRKLDESGRQFNLVEYLFGPRFSAHTGRATFFCHTLAGGLYHDRMESQTNPTAISEGNSFAMAYGGGIDIDVSEKFAVRVVQFDWIPFLENGSLITNTTRFGFGVVIRSEKKSRMRMGNYSR